MKNILMVKTHKIIILQSQSWNVRQIFSLTICCGLVLLVEFAFSPPKRNLPEIPLGEGKPSKPGLTYNIVWTIYYHFIIFIHLLTQSHKLIFCRIFLGGEIWEGETLTPQIANFDTFYPKKCIFSIFNPEFLNFWNYPPKMLILTILSQKSAILTNLPLLKVKNVVKLSLFF